MPLAKPCDKLTLQDFKKHPVWEFDLDNECRPGRDETGMIPVRKLPVTDLSNRICLAKATMACGREIAAVLGNVDLPNAEETEKYILFSTWTKDKRWVLHGSDKPRQAAELARALGLDLEDVFPIAYDISAFATGPAKIIRSFIGKGEKGKGIFKSEA